MKLHNTEHTSRPWRIHEIAHDFGLEDVWALPTPGGPDDFPHLVRQMVAFDPFDNPSRIFRALFAIRLKLGALLGLDDPREMDPGHQGGATIRDRVPADLRDSRGPDFQRVPFRSLYLAEDEWATELANNTIHGVMHLSWVKDESGGYRGQMAVLVKPNGRLGKAYMAAIKPFRIAFVYPPLMKAVGRAWESTPPPAPSERAPGNGRVDSTAPVR